MRKISSWAIILFLILGAGCGRFAETEQGATPNINPNPNNNPGVNYEILSVILNLFPTSVVPNRIEFQDPFLFVLNSGGNNIQRVQIDTQSSNNSFITLPPGSNPWEMAVRGNLGFVTNFAAQNVSVVNLDSGGNAMATISANAQGGFQGPEGIAISENGYAYVANTDITFSGAQYMGRVL